MTQTGIIEESAYYESLHELPLIATQPEKLHEMNCIISGYGIWLRLSTMPAKPLLTDFMKTIDTNGIGKSIFCYK
jgi:ketol-acid reductoisomerase